MGEIEKRFLPGRAKKHRTKHGSCPKNEALEVTAMVAEMRKSGVVVVGDMPWGTHFCLFETKVDLLETLVCYCKAGLESQEFCLW